MSSEHEFASDDEAAPPPPPMLAPPAPAKPKPEKRFAPASAPARNPESDLAIEDSQSMVDWLRSFGGQGALKVNITRIFPMKGKNDELIGGSLETPEELIDEDYIRSRWGGGTFTLRVMNPTKGGYLKGRTIKLAGPPKMHGRVVPGFGDDGEATNGGGGMMAMPQREDASTVAKAMDHMAKLTDRAEERAERMINGGGGRGGFDHEMMRELQAPLLAELAESRRALAAMQAQMITVANKPPERDEFRDKLMTHMMEGESTRLETLRTTYETRLAKLRDDFDGDMRRDRLNHEEAIKRIEDRHEKEIKRLEDRHERDLKQSDKVAELTSKTGESNATTRIDALQAEKARLERELTASATKIAALEARKDQTITEKADELIKVQEALQGLGGGTEGDEKWWEKAIAAVGNTEAVGNLINKFTGGPNGGAPAQQPAMNEPPIGVPFRGPDGQVYIRPAHNPNVVMLVNQQQLGQQRGLAQARERKRKQRPAGDPAAANANADPTAAQGEAVGEGDVMAQGVALEAEAEPEIAQGPPAGRPPTPSELEMAVGFLEATIRSGKTSPEQVARTAGSLIPNDVLAYMGSIGIDKFFAAAKLEPGSVLKTINGRRFLRQVHRALIGEPVEETK